MKIHIVVTGDAAEKLDEVIAPLDVPKHKEGEGWILMPKFPADLQTATDALVEVMLRPKVKP